MNIPDYQIRVLEKEEITCKDVKDLMCDYADNELTASLQERLDLHVVRCNRCKHFKETYLQTIEIASELKDAPVPDGVRSRLRQALNEKLGLNLSVDL